MMDISNLIDMLDALVNTSSKMPGTRSRMVDEEKIMDLIQQLRLAVPQDIRAAQEVIERKDAILNQAQIDARTTRNSAEAEFRSKVDQHEVVAAARKKSEEMTTDSERRIKRLADQAEAEARNSRAEADAYVTQSLRNLEREMTSVLSAVRNGLDALGANVRV
jgi:hypothetical protein